MQGHDGYVFYALEKLADISKSWVVPVDKMGNAESQNTMFSFAERVLTNAPLAEQEVAVISFETFGNTTPVPVMDYIAWICFGLGYTKVKHFSAVKLYDMESALIEEDTKLIIVNKPWLTMEGNRDVLSRHSRWLLANGRGTRFIIAPIVVEMSFIEGKRREFEGIIPKPS